jgi:serine/threonine-protein kinase
MGAGALLRPGPPPAVTQPSTPVVASAGDARPVPAAPSAVAQPEAPAPTPENGTPPVAAAADGGTPSPVAVADAGTPGDAGTVAEVKAKGVLVVRAIPFATVLLNGKRLGEVQGRASYSLAAGQYKLTFVHPISTKSHTITIEPNGSVQREFRVAPPR